ncbi:MAG: hypothetical protein LBV67_04585 [Streptococcaceae bacterium]|jgi:hypothetical protein|nr:hypothetical protein [Streptococcaceae bacterium]
MIISEAKKIKSNFLANELLKNWVAKFKGIPNIAIEMAEGELPHIVIKEIENYPDLHADDEEYSTILTYQINLTSKNGDHFNAMQAVHEEMIALGYTRLAISPAIPNTKTKEIEKQLVYSQCL